jgi:predicted metal-dependent enzyme (double-stranded beta helix superfamily)
MVPAVSTLEIPTPTPTLDPAELGAVAGRLASFANRWSAMAAPHPDRRWYARLHRDAAHDVWLLGWDQAQGIDLHDHGGSSGAFCVVTGRLVEAYTDRTTQPFVQRRQVGKGEVLAFAPDHVHDLTNPGPGAAVSIHVYSPPLQTMTFYDDAPGTFLSRLRTEPADSPEGSGVA